MNEADALVQKAQTLLAEAGIEQARMEAQLLMALALDTTRTAIVAGLRSELTLFERSRFETLLSRRLQHVPLAYLRGTQEFYGLTFAVTPDVLIPRPETELLVEFVLEQESHAPGLRFADVGTGSGCIPIAVLAHARAAHAIAIDVSGAALRVARGNAERSGVFERLRLVRGSLLEAVIPKSLDVVVSNPPYIATRDLANLQPEVREREPRLALDGGRDGLTLVRALTIQASQSLRPGGALAMEIGQEQAQAVVELCGRAGFADIGVRPDLAGIARVVHARKRL